MTEVETFSIVFILFVQAPSRVHTLTSLCLLSHHPFVSNFRQCLAALRELVEAAEAAAAKASPARWEKGNKETGAAMKLRQ